MADVTPILIKDLAAQTTLADTDYFIVGGADAKKITVAQMKEALGINALNTKTDMSGSYSSRIWIKAEGGNVGSTTIPFPNADQYNITITSLEMFGAVEKPQFYWNIDRHKNGFSISSAGADQGYYFGTAYPNRLWDLFFTATHI